MNNHLTLPPERHLSEKRRREMGAVLDRASRSATKPRRTWLALAPAMAIAAVAALIFGLNHLGGVAVPVVGTPTPSTDTASLPSDGATMTPAAPARSVDRGPLRAAAARKLAAGCNCDGPRYVVKDVLFARHTSTNGDVVIYVGGDGTTYARAHNPGMSMGGPGGPVRPEPSRTRPVVQLTGTLTGTSSSHGFDEISASTYYRLDPEVASLQMRIIVDGRTGPWFDASMAGGYAWAAASMDHKTPKDADAGPGADVRVEDRAFDAQGRVLDIDHY